MELKSVADRNQWSEPKLIAISPTVAEEWNEVGKVHTLSTDTEIACFLLHLYKADAYSSGNISCMVCKKTLSVAFCLPCAVSYRAACDSHSEAERQNSASPCRVVKTENNNVNKDDEDSFVKVHFEKVATQHGTFQPRQEEINSTAAVCKRRRGRPRKTPFISCGDNTEHAAPDAALGHDGLRRKGSCRLQNCASKKRTCSEMPTQSLAPLSHLLPRFHRGNRNGSKLKQANVVLKKSGKNFYGLALQVISECSAEKDSSHFAKLKTCSTTDNPTSKREAENNNYTSNVNTKTGLANSLRPAAVESSQMHKKQTKQKDSTVKRNETGVRKGRKSGIHSCDLCDSVFKEQYLLKRHKAIHSKDHGKDWEYHCQQCTRSFKKKGALDAHLRTHTGQKLFICAICNEPFALTKQLKRHIQAKHSDVVSTATCYKCAQCEATFARDRKLYIHVYRHTVEKKYQCEVCSKAFADAAMLKMHMRVHTDERPFTCTECGFSFRQLGSLTTHMQRHRGERNFTCHLCPVSYYSKFQLKMHLAAHKGEKSYLCQLCGSGYTNSKSLQIHMRSHTGERPFKCEVCGKDFARPSSFRQHKLTHSDTRPYSCAVCTMTFVDNSNLHRHLRLKHSDKEKERTHCAATPGPCSRGGERGAGDGGEGSGVEAPVSSCGSSSSDMAGEGRISQNPEQTSYPSSEYLKEQQLSAQVHGEVPSFGDSFRTSIGIGLKDGLGSLTNRSRVGLTGSSGLDMTATAKNDIDNLRRSGLSLHNRSVSDNKSRLTEDRSQLQDVGLHDLLTKHHIQYHYPC